LNAVGYLRVSTAEQAASGLGLEAQKRAIAGEVERRGWRLVDFAGDTGSAKSIRKRPGFERVLDQLDAGEYEALIVSRLDRAWRSVGDFATTMDRAAKHGWLVVLLDPAVDMTTPFGRAMAGVAAVFAQLERELLSQRTSEGIRAGYASGKIRPPQPEVSAAASKRILQLAGEGMSHRRIARALTVEGIASPRGGRWHHSTVGVELRRRR
jgi:DNA invertase Pin-like site-specific DNA recombinase